MPEGERRYCCYHARWEDVTAETNASFGYVKIPPRPNSIRDAVNAAIWPTLGEIRAARESAWDEGFAAGERDVWMHQVNDDWDSECPTNPYRREN